MADFIGEVNFLTGEIVKAGETCTVRIAGHEVEVSNADGFTVGQETVSEGSCLFCAPKHFDFADPQLTATAEDGWITVTAGAYARQVWIESDDADMLLADNAFDMNPGVKRIQVLRGKAENLRVRSVYNLGR